MLSRMSNRRLLGYIGVSVAIGAVLCFRAGNWAIGGVLVAVSGSCFALAWLAYQNTHPHLHSK